MSIRPRKRTQTVISQAKAYDTILRPVVTEKATMGNEHGRVSFFVAMDATKPEIKAAVEMLFNVKVMAVNTIIQKGKKKMFRVVRVVVPMQKRQSSHLLTVRPLT